MDEELIELQNRITQLNENVEDLQAKNDQCRLQVRLYQNKINYLQKEKPADAQIIIKDYEKKIDDLKVCLRYCNEQQDRMIQKFRQAEEGLTQTQAQKDIKYIENLAKENIKINKLHKQMEFQEDRHLQDTLDLREENNKMRRNIDELLSITGKLYTSYFPTIETLIAFFKRNNTVKENNSPCSTKSEPAPENKKIKKQYILKIKGLKSKIESLQDELLNKQEDLNQQRINFQHEIQAIKEQQTDPKTFLEKEELTEAKNLAIELKERNKKQKEQNIQKDKQIQELKQKVDELLHIEDENEKISQKSVTQAFEKQHHLKIIGNQEREIADLKLKLGQKKQCTQPSPIWSEFYFNELPGELIPSFMELVHNPSLAAPVKLNMGLKALKSYYDNLLDEEKKHSRNIIKRIETADSFIREIGHLVIDNDITSEDLMNNVEIQPRITHKIEEDHFRMIDDFSKSTEKISILQKRISELEHNIECPKPQKKEAKVYNKTKLISKTTNTDPKPELMHKTINTKQDIQVNWPKKTKYLEDQLNKERKSFIEQLKRTKQQTINEYENLVKQLRKRCDEQHSTIESLTAQIQTYPYK